MTATLLDNNSLVVVGGGVFGLSTALAWKRRFPDAAVTLLECADAPHDARAGASCDLNKIIRYSYSGSAVYRDLALAAIEAWQAQLPHLYHNTGVVFCAPVDRLTEFPFAVATLACTADCTFPSSGKPVPAARPFEGAGRFVDTGAALSDKFPGFAPAGPLAGYLQPVGGFARAADAVRAVRDMCIRLGVRVVEHPDQGRAISVTKHKVTTADGTVHTAARVVVAAGSWTPQLVPTMIQHVRRQYMPVLHLQVPEHCRDTYASHNFPVWAIVLDNDILVYGFPATDSGIIKLAIDYPGFSGELPENTELSAPVGLPASTVPHFVRVIKHLFPELLDFPVAYTRLCPYANTRTHHFAIDTLDSGVVVATGGSGHAYKFFPVLGDLVVAAALDEPHPLRQHFALEDALDHHLPHDAWNRCDQGPIPFAECTFVAMQGRTLAQVHYGLAATDASVPHCANGNGI